jgi:hypothetical protein
MYQGNSLLYKNLFFPFEKHSMVLSLGPYPISWWTFRPQAKGIILPVTSTDIVY